MSMSRRVTTSDDVELLVSTRGNASNPALIFSNSLGARRAMWEHQAAILGERYFIILYDTRGHGESAVADGACSLDRLGLDVLEIMDALQVPRAHFCGLSLGGMTGQLLGARAPERFTSLVLAATSAYMGPPSLWQTRITTVLDDGMAAICDAVLERWFAPARYAVPEAVEAARDWLLATDPAGYAGCCAAIRDMDLRAIAPVNRVSSLILAGEDDMATPSDHAEFLRAAMPRASLGIMPGGHLLNLEQPDRFTAALSAFLGARGGGALRPETVS